MMPAIMSIHMIKAVSLLVGCACSALIINFYQHRCLCYLFVFFYLVYKTDISSMPMYGRNGARDGSVAKTNAPPRAEVHSRYSE